MSAGRGMSPGFEQAFARALDDLRHDRLADPEAYLSMVPRARRDEFVDRLTAAMVDRPPTAALTAEAHGRALAAVATARAAGGPAGILPGALVALRHARGIERDDVLDHLAAEFDLGADARPTLRRLYHQLESGTLLGANVSRRLLASLARRFDARVEDFVAAVQPTGPAGGPAAPAMARGARAGTPRGGGARPRRRPGPAPVLRRPRRLARSPIPARRRWRCWPTSKGGSTRARSRRCPSSGSPSPTSAC